MLIPIIMAGGCGERLWPLSRLERPKQFLSFQDGISFLRKTFNRLIPFIEIENIYVITNSLFRDLVCTHLPELKEHQVIIEPLIRNTAACLGLAITQLARRYPIDDTVIVTLPSDHFIQDETEFISILQSAEKMARKGEYVVSLGVRPSRPETGYGYISYCTQEIDIDGYKIFPVNQFIEKPSVELAQSFIQSDRYLWNTGIYICKISTLKQLIIRHMPTLYSGLKKIESALGTPHERSVIYEVYFHLDSISIDVGVIEKTKSLLVIPCNIGWDDIGTWLSLSRILQPDCKGNIIQGNVTSIDTSDSIIIESDEHRKIAILGIKDTIIVDTKDVVLIASKKYDQSIKTVMANG